MPKIYSNEETLDYIIESGKSIARFGDGEFHILGNAENLGFQEVDSRLSKRLIEVLTTSLDNCLVCLPGGLSSIKGLNAVGTYFWKQFIVFHYRKYIKYIDFDKKYFNASVTRPYMDYQDKSHSAAYFKKMKQLWDNKKVLVIEGELSRLGVGNDLFVNCKSIDRVITKSKNAFSCYDKIYSYTSSIIANYDLVLVALGPTATVLAYDLSKLGLSNQVLDIGHIDVEYGWFLVGAEEKVQLEGKFVNEVATNLDNVSDQDLNYESQVIQKILD